MYDYDRRHAVRLAALRARLFFAMSMEDAKAVLGFPPGSHPSPSEVNKAYKMKAVENHPDRGGSHEKMVEINVAKEILEGKRREDRTPYKPTPKGPDPKEEAERARKQREEEDERGRRETLQRLEEEEKKLDPAVDAAIRSSDFAQGRLYIPSFLTQDFTGALDKIHDEIESSPKSPDMLKAKAITHTLTGMAVRLAKRAQKITQDHGTAHTVVLGMGGDLTYKSIVAMHVEMAKFIEGWTELHAESRNLMGLINTSENVPLTWDLYLQPHQIIDSFSNDFKGFSGHALQHLEKILKSVIMSVEGMIFGYGYRIKTGWADWKIPGDFQKIEEYIKAHKRS